MKYAKTKTQRVAQALRLSGLHCKVTDEWTVGMDGSIDILHKGIRKDRTINVQVGITYVIVNLFTPRAGGEFHHSRDTTNLDVCLAQIQHAVRKSHQV